MRNGVPVCASNLPGVRQPVTMTGMGKVVPIGDHEALAEAVIEILSEREQFVKSAETISNAFSPHHTAREYLKLYGALKTRTFDRSVPEPEPYQQLRKMRDEFESVSN